MTPAPHRIPARSLPTRLRSGMIRGTAALAACALAAAPAVLSPAPGSATASAAVPATASGAVPATASAAVPATASASGTSVPLAQAAKPSPSETLYERAKIADGAPAPQPRASAWIVADMESGEVFASHDIDAQLAPASVIKLLTALALTDALPDKDAPYTAGFEDMAIDGTKVGIVEKNDYTIDQLFHAMLMSSGNDAAHALGEAVGGQDKAVELMTAKAQELGLTGTVPKNTSGLDAEGQVTTVRDLLVIAKAVLADDYLMRVIATENFDFPGGVNPQTKEKFAGFPIQNHTKIVGRVDGGLGLKNGYTVASRGSFVAAVQREGRTYASAVLHSENSTREAAVDLIDWSFAQRSPRPEMTVQLTPTPTPEPTPAADRGQDRAGTSAAEASGANADRAGWAGGNLPFVLITAAGLLLGAGAVGFLLLRRRQAARRR